MLFNRISSKIHRVSALISCFQWFSWLFCVFARFSEAIFIGKIINSINYSARASRAGNIARMIISWSRTACSYIAPPASPPQLLLLAGQLLVRNNEISIMYWRSSNRQAKQKISTVASIVRENRTASSDTQPGWWMEQTVLVTVPLLQYGFLVGCAACENEVDQQDDGAVCTGATFDGMKENKTPSICCFSAPYTNERAQSLFVY